MAVVGMGGVGGGLANVSGGTGGSVSMPADGGETTFGGAGGEAPSPQHRPMPNPVSANLPHPAAYDTATKGVVLDKVTSLMWQRDVLVDAEHSYQFDEVGAVCDALELGGFSDWRVPSRQELLTLVDYTVANPAIDPTAFPQERLGNLWTSTPVADEDSSWWVLSFDYGQPFPRMSPLPVDGFVRCVRGAKFSTSYVQGTGPLVGTIADETTGLLWQQVAPQTALNATGASSYCDSLALGGFDDWRVPSIKELQLVIDESQADPAIDVSLFSGGDSATDLFWSSSTNAPGLALPGYWTLHMGNARQPNPLDGASLFNVRCVR